MQLAQSIITTIQQLNASICSTNLQPSTNIQGVHKLSEDFAKPYFHKYWTEIHDVTIIWKRNVCSFLVTLNAFDVRPTCDKADVQAILLFGGNGSISCTSAVSQVGRTSYAFKVTMKLQTFLFQMVVTSCISVQYLWKYGFAKSSDNLYAPCISGYSLRDLRVSQLWRWVILSFVMSRRVFW